MYLMQQQGLPEAQAYDVARKEFYEARHLEDVERQVSKEEALHYGAYFSKGPNEIGMELEDAQWELWKEWAIKQIELQKSQTAAAYSGTGSDDEVLALSPTDEQAASEGIVDADVAPEASFVPAPSAGANLKI
jgi:small subunit ribosomal protein S23